MSTRMYRSTTPGNYAPVKFIAPVTSVAAYQECGLAGKAGGDATGLTVDFKGYQELGLSGLVGGDETGLSAGTNGYQEFGLSGLTLAGETGLDVLSSGYQELGLAALTGATETGLAPTTQYYVKLNVDGGGVTEYDITTAADTTWTAVLALLNVELLGSGVFALVGGDVRFTSDTTGATSTVAITAGTTGTDLLVTLTGFTAVNAAVDGLEGEYKVKVNEGGSGATEYTIQFTTTSTWDDLITLLQAEVGGDITIDLVGDDIRVTHSAVYGTASTIAITAGDTLDLLAALSATPDVAVDGVVAPYYVKVALDGAAASERHIDVDGDSTWTAVLALLGPAMDAGLTGVTWTLVGGDIRVTSPTDGGASAIALSAGTTGDDLFANLTGFTAFDTPISGQPRYYLTISPNEDGPVEVYIEPDDAVTFTAVIALLNAEMTGALDGFVWAISGGDLRCTAPLIPKNAISMSAGTTGVDFFASLTGFTALDAPVARVTSAEDPRDYSNIPSAGETRPYPINGAKDTAVFVWGDTNVTGDVTVYVAPSPTGPWAAVAVATSNPTTAGAAIVVPAGYLAADFIKVGVGAYTGGPLRAVVSSVRPNGNHIW